MLVLLLVGLQCVDYVFDEMQRVALQCETDELTRFPELRERTFEIVNAMLRDCLKPTQRMISSIIKVELAYINTSHPDFIGGKQAIATITKKLNQQQQQQQQQLQGGSHNGNGASISDKTPNPSDFDPNHVLTSNKERSGSYTAASGASSAVHTSGPPPPPAAAAAMPFSSPAPSAPAGGGGFFSFLKPAPSTPVPNSNVTAPGSSANTSSHYEGLMQKMPPVAQQGTENIVKLPQVRYLVCSFDPSIDRSFNVIRIR